MPPKSACIYCPFSKKGDFQKVARELPGSFEQLVSLESLARRTKKGATIRFGGKQSLTEWVATPYRPQKPKPCPVCGAPVAAEKHIDCG